MTFGLLDDPAVPPPIRLYKPEEAVAATPSDARSGTD